jgi:hypothetical protein
VRPRSRAALLVAAVPALLRCSLMVGDAVPACTAQAQCEVLNVERNIAAGACERYVCSPVTQRCTLTADGDGDGEARAGCGGADCDDTPATGRARAHNRAEVADGVDNNCNTVVDEGVWIDAPRELGPSTAAPASMVAARSGAASGGLGLMTSDGSSAAFFGLVGDGVPAFTPVTLRTVLTRSEAQTQEPGWPRGTPDAPVLGAGLLTDLVGAPGTSGRWLAAAVNSDGCALGSLFVAAFAPMSPSLMIDFQRPPRGSSNVALGLPAQCGGASRPSLALAARAGQPDRGLVLWQSRGANARATACGTPATIRALGVWPEPQPAAAMMAYDRVQGLHDGAPSDLDGTLGSGRPAVEALPDAASFVVAYGLAGGGVALRVVPLFEPSTTASLDLGRTRLVIASDPAMPVDEVALALGGVREGRPEVGVAWREGCGPAGALRFARVRLDAADPARSVVDRAATVMARGAAPTLAYLDSGMLQGAAGDAAPRVAESDDGGWVLAWADATGPAARVRALRVSEATGDVVRIPASGACVCAGAEAIGEVATVTGSAMAFSLHTHDEGAPSRLRVLAVDATQWRSVALAPRRAATPAQPPPASGACACR